MLVSLALGHLPPRSIPLFSLVSVSLLSPVFPGCVCRVEGSRVIFPRIQYFFYNSINRRFQLYSQCHQVLFLTGLPYLLAYFQPQAYFCAVSPSYLALSDRKETQLHALLSVCGLLRCCVGDQPSGSERSDVIGQERGCSFVTMP